MKKKYVVPSLERFGTVSQLSAGGSGPIAELDTGVGNQDPETGRQRP